MRITGAHIRSLLDSPAEDPVLHIERDEDTGAPVGLGVWARAYVPHRDIIARRTDVVDVLGGEPDDDTIADYASILQDEADQAAAQ